MHPHPDIFEWKLFHRSFLGLCIFFLAVYALSLAALFLPGPLPYPHQEVALVLRGGGLAALAGALVLALRMRPLDPRLFPLAQGVTILLFLVALGMMAGTGINLILGQGSFLVISALFLGLFGFFNRNQGFILGAGVLNLVLVSLLFLVWPGAFFHQELTIADTAKYMDQILFFGVTAVTALTFLNNQTSVVLYQRARDSADRLGRIAFWDGETDLPNGLGLERDLGSWQPGTVPEESRVVLAGFRLDGLEGLNETRGLEFTSGLLKSVVLGFARGLADWELRPGGSKPPRGLSGMYRVEGNAFLFPLVLAWGTLPDTKPFKEILTRVVREANVGLTHGRTLRFHGGFTVHPDDGPNLRQLSRNLLNLLHGSRAGAAGEFTPFNPKSHQEFVRREQIREALALAVGEPEVFVVFQPKVRLSDGSLAGFEALSRWLSPLFGMVSPAEFIPLAEQHSFIEALTLKVVDRSAALVKDLVARGDTGFRVSVNLSPGLLTPRFLERLSGLCASERLGPFLELEITEGMMMVLDPAVHRPFRELRTLGVTFSIDDFGTGYSNLAYLQEFDADVLKVDKRFIDGIPGDEKSEKLIRAILLLARSFGTRVIAEGVETVEQRDFLAEVGCDQIQGYYYSKPLGYEEALEYPKVVDLRPPG